MASLIEGEAYVGEVLSIGYNEALVQIHDFNRQQVGGVPALSFLLATRITPGTTPDIRKEDSSLILLRVPASDSDHGNHHRRSNDGDCPGWLRAESMPSSSVTVAEASVGPPFWAKAETACPKQTARRATARTGSNSFQAFSWELSYSNDSRQRVLPINA